MGLRSFFGRRVSFPISRSAPALVALLVALAWSTPAFGDEIHDAAKNGDLAKVQALLKQNPGLVFSKDHNGWTPLHHAAEGGHKNVAELLLAKEADVNAKNEWGRPRFPLLECH